MKKTLAASLAVASIAGALAVTPAHAQRGVAAGVAAGLIGGAIVGGAIASRPYYYPYGPYPYYGRPCRVWNGYAWVPAAC